MQVSVEKLLWDRLDREGARAGLLSRCEGGFDLIVASDCLFFKVILTIRKSYKCDQNEIESGSATLFFLYSRSVCLNNPFVGIGH